MSPPHYDKKIQNEEWGMRTTGLLPTGQEVAGSGSGSHQRKRVANLVRKARIEHMRTCSCASGVLSPITDGVGGAAENIIYSSSSHSFCGTTEFI
jgi:hypothetical protein